MRSKRHPAFIQCSTRGKTEYLVPAAVGEDRMRPSHEGVQAAAPCDQVVARSEVEVVRVAKDDRGASLLEIARRHRFDCALRANRHEHRRFDDTMRRGQSAAPCTAVVMRQFKRHSDNPSQRDTEFLVLESWGEEAAGGCDLWWPIR